MVDAPDSIRLHPPTAGLRGQLQLDSSKSISNRALTILALIGANPDLYLTNVSAAQDTRILQRLLADPTGPYDAGEAGTVFRFMTAFLALQPGEKLLTGSARMLERPVGPLVDALNRLGAEVHYTQKVGYPPLRIGDGWKMGLHNHKVYVPAHISSQFLSALAMVGPILPNGLVIRPEGTLVSRPYIDMTVHLMHHMGAACAWTDGALHIESGSYRPKPLRVEADWSSASYLYAMAALRQDADLVLEGLSAESWQGDVRIMEIAAQFGVETTALHNGVRLTHSGDAPKPVFECDFTDCPDLFPSVSVMCAGLGVQGLFSGLESLRIKESDRIEAMKTELAKVGVSLSQLPPRFNKKKPDVTFFMQEGKAAWDAPPVFDTWNDHRIAMATAAFSMLGEVEVRNPGVVEKSYPGFWVDVLHVFSKDQ
jgi:3-phosphoshikimate 1-carboxyvinyltransferase